MARDDYGAADQQAVTSWREKKAKDLRVQLRRELANFLSESLAHEARAGWKRKLPGAQLAAQVPARRAGALATATRFPLPFEELASFEEETFDSAAPPTSARSGQVGSIQRVGRTTPAVSDNGSCWQAASCSISKPLRLLHDDDKGMTFPLAVQGQRQMADDKSQSAPDEGTAKIATPRVSGHIVSLVAAAAQEALVAEEETQQPFDNLASIRNNADQRDPGKLSASWPGCAQSLDLGHRAAGSFSWDEPSKSSLMGHEDDFSASPYTDGLDVEALTVSTIADAAFELPAPPLSLAQQKRKPGCIYNTISTSAVPSSATSCAGSFAAAPRVTPTLLCSTEAAVRSGVSLGTPAKSWATPSPPQPDGQDEVASPIDSSSSDLGQSPGGPGPECKCPPPSRLPLCLGRPDPSATPAQSANAAGAGPPSAIAPQAVRMPEEHGQQRSLSMPGAGPVLGAPCSVQAGAAFPHSSSSYAGQGFPAEALKLKLPLAALESERNYITKAVPAFCAAPAAAPAVSCLPAGMPLRQSSSASSIAPVMAAAPAAYAQPPGYGVHHGLCASGSTTPPWVQHHQAYGALPGVSRQQPPRAQDNLKALTAQFESVTNELTRHLQQGGRDLDPPTAPCGSGALPAYQLDDFKQAQMDGVRLRHLQQGGRDLDAPTPPCGSGALPAYQLDDFKQAQMDGVRLRPGTSAGLHILPPPPSLMPPPS